MGIKLVIIDEELVAKLAADLLQKMNFKNEEEALEYAREVLEEHYGGK